MFRYNTIACLKTIRYLSSNKTGHTRGIIRSPIFYCFGFIVHNGSDVDDPLLSIQVRSEFYSIWSQRACVSFDRPTSKASLNPQWVNCTEWDTKKSKDRKTDLVLSIKTLSSHKILKYNIVSGVNLIHSRIPHPVQSSYFNFTIGPWPSYVSTYTTSRLLSQEMMIRLSPSLKPSAIPPRWKMNPSCPASFPTCRNYPVG